MALFDRMISSTMGQRAQLDAKLEEFRGLRLVGDAAGAEKCREQAHTLLDSYLDGQAECAVVWRRGGFR